MTQKLVLQFNNLCQDPYIEHLHLEFYLEM